MPDIIQDLIEAEDLLEANQHLKIIDEALEKQTVNRSVFCRDLAFAIVDWTVRGKPDPVFETPCPYYSIYKPFSTVPAYLASFGMAFGKVREMRVNIKKLILDIDETIVKPSGNYITVEGEEKVLSILTEKFPKYWQIVSAKRKLEVINVNNSHRQFNSICGTNEDATAFIIYMFNMKEESLLPEYVFLHELGHALQIAATRSYQLVPDEFLRFNNSLQTESLEQGDSIAPELFADTFAIAVMRGSYLNDKNPFPFSDELNEVFERFHTSFLKQLTDSILPRSFRGV